MHYSALGTAIGLKKLLEKSSSTLLKRFVPFAAVGSTLFLPDSHCIVLSCNIQVASANCVNIPLMRQQELFEGISLTEESGEQACRSRVHAREGIAKVVLSRVVMAAPGMFCLPFIMQRMETRPWFKARPALHGPFKVWREHFIEG